MMYITLLHSTALRSTIRQIFSFRVSYGLPTTIYVCVCVCVCVRVRACVRVYVCVCVCVT
jgi:hypothetical protein